MKYYVHWYVVTPTVASTVVRIYQDTAVSNQDDWHPIIKEREKEIGINL
jgi:hypothetical protein